MLGSASPTTGQKVSRGNRIGTPRSRYHPSSIRAPPLMVTARKYSGLSSRSENFISGQFRPQTSVRATSATSCARLVIKPPPGP